MIQMLVEPGAQDIRYRLGEIAPPAFTLGIDRVAHDPEVGLLGVGHHRGRNLLRITRVRHCWVAIRRLGVHHWWIRLRVAPVCHGAWYRAGLTGAIVRRKGIGPRCHPAVGGIPFPLGHGLQVPDGWEDRTRSSHRHGIAHRPWRVLACAGCVFAGMLAIGDFGGGVCRVSGQ